MNFLLLIKPCMFRTQSRANCCSITIVFAYFKKAVQLGSVISKRDFISWSSILQPAEEINHMGLGPRQVLKS